MATPEGTTAAAPLALGEVDASKFGKPEERGDIIDVQGTVIDDKEDPAAAAKTTEGTEEDDAAAIAAGAKSGSVPHAVFHKKNEALKTATQELVRTKAELEALRGSATAATTGATAGAAAAAAEKKDEVVAVDLKKLRADRIEAMYKGETDVALALEEQIDAENLRIAEERAYTRIKSETVQETVNSVAVEVIGKYPFFADVKNGGDPEAIADLLSKRDFYIAQGESAPDALRKAAEKLAPLYGAPAAAAPGAAVVPINKAAQRAVAERTAAAAAAQQIPTAGAGERAIDTTKSVDVGTLTDSQFQALPDDEKRRARGDYRVGP